MFSFNLLISLWPSSVKGFLDFIIKAAEHPSIKSLCLTPLILNSSKKGIILELISSNFLPPLGLGPGP
jgi:hypothetical protein